MSLTTFKYVLVLALLLLPRLVEAQSQRKAGQYPLSNRVMLRWTPSALIGVSSRSLRVGAEYLFARQFGIDLEGGPELPLARSGTSPGLRGWNVYLTPKCYFGMNRHGRGFIGLHSFYRQISEDSGRTTAYLDGIYSVTFSQRSARRTAAGGGFCGGYMAHLGAGLHIELCNGLGYKEVRVDRDIVVPFAKREEGSLLVPEERSRFDRGGFLYFIFEFKIGWLIGGYPRAAPGLAE